MEQTQGPRLFADDASISRIGEGMMVPSLAREDWTHEAHIATCLWLILERPDVDPEQDLPGLIRRFNESVGGINDETQGYHETITQCFIAGVRGWLARQSERAGLTVMVNALLQAPEGQREWPLRFYSKERLFSVEARLSSIEPDKITPRDGKGDQLQVGGGAAPN